MAMRHQPGGLTDNFPRMLTRGTSEDFQPKFELKEEAAAYIISVHLPGFVKERIKITYVDSTRTIRAVGERPLGNNRWSEFNQTYSVPENCDAAKIERKFEQGILTITMPKKNLHADLPKDTSTEDVEKPIDKTSMKSASEIVDQRSIEKKDTVIEACGKAKETKESDNAMEKSIVKEKESAKKRAESARPESSAPKSSKNRKEKRVISVSNQRKRKEGINTGIGVGVKIALDSAKQKVKNLTRRLNEDERQMLVNLGAAVLVLVALGAYVYFRHRSSGRAED